MIPVPNSAQNLDFYFSLPVERALKELMNEFLDYCRGKDMSPASIKGYRNDIEICWVWNLQHNKNKFYILDPEEILKELAL